MKKLLMILGSISLLALSGSSVVSCAIKVKAKPNFYDLWDINEKSWNPISKYFAADEIALNPDVDQDINKEDYLYHAILNDFNNPTEVAKYFDKYDVKYSVQSYYTVYDNNEKEQYTNATIWLKAFEKEGPNAFNMVYNPRANLQIVVYPEPGVPGEYNDNAKTRLLDPRIRNNNLVLDRQDSEEIYRQLAKVAHQIQSLRLKSDEDVAPQVKRIMMEEFDMATKNLMIDKINKKYLPFADTDTFNETIGQQFKYLEKGYDLLNETVFQDLKKLVNDKNALTNNNTNVNTQDIANRIESITLDDLTLTFTNKTKKELKEEENKKIVRKNLCTKLI